MRQCKVLRLAPVLVTATGGWSRLPVSAATAEDVQSINLRSRVQILVLLLLLIVAALPVAAAGPTLVTIDDDIPANALREIVGSGIVLPDGAATEPAQDSDGRAIVWKEHKRGTDPDGGLHVLYRQFLVAAGVEAELVGAEIGLHYEPSGRLQLLHGTQFQSVLVVNDASHEPSKEDPHIDALSLQRRVLEVRTDEPSGAQRFVWRLPVRDVGLSVDVLMDAQSGAVVAANDTMRLNACYPDSMSAVSAKGVPVRAGSGLPANMIRWLGATPSDRNGYTHEAFWPAGPLLAVHQWMPLNDSAYEDFRCEDEPGKQYGLVPLSMSGGYPIYTDDNLFWGRAAGDAMYNTYLTMDAFWRLGRNSWDGNWGNATVIIDSPSVLNLTDTAWFAPGYPTGLTPPGMPPGASVNIAPESNYWNAAASLDWIAHEWGHGVTDGRFDLNTFVGRSMDEGFSDIIATIVEKTQQPPNANSSPPWAILEQSADWVMHEDAAQGGYARGAEDDGPAGHTWVARMGASRTFRDMIHRQDPDVAPAGQGHTNGNMLVMAMRMMSEGGKNPICGRPPNPPGAAPFQGCPAQEPGPNGTTINNPPIAGIGFPKASRIWWHAVTNGFVGAGTTWENIANSMLLSARSVYRRCPNSPALAEQNAVILAFRYIGYPGTGTLTATGCP